VLFQADVDKIPLGYWKIKVFYRMSGEEGPCALSNPSFLFYRWANRVSGKKMTFPDAR
jgi:hypothetical protein